MPEIQQRVEQFIREQGLDYTQTEPKAFYENFRAEMHKGLSGQNSSLEMLPTYVRVDRPTPHGRPVLVIDAGGTNLRVCTVTFDEHGKGHIENFRQFPMPGTHGELSAEVFFSLFSEYVSPILDEQPEIDSIGFCFSYPSEILPNCDGRLIRWSKEVQAPEVVGKLIGENLLAHLKNGIQKKVVILNDTVAALLAAKAQGEIHQCSNYAGFILGTGTNLAIVMPNQQIPKISHRDPQGNQAINLESGNFNLFPISKIDQRFDTSTQNPGSYTFEKMVSGAYLGSLFLTCLKAASENELFSSVGKQQILSLQSVSTKQLNDLLSNPYEEGPFVGLSETDLEIAVRLGSHLVQRASWLCALKIAAGVLAMEGGRHILHPICINIDGSTVHKMFGFYNSMAANLKLLLGKEGVHFLLVHKENAPIFGAAIAALIH